MRRTLLIIFLLTATCIWALAAGGVKVTRAALETLEKSFDERIIRLNVTEPFDLLGATRGVYLDGYGVVFTTEVSLIVTPSPTPFRPSISAEEIAKVRERKLAQLPLLRRAMRDMLIASAVALDILPADQQIVVAVTLFHYSWEDSRGLPGQLVMQAPRKTLLDLQAGRLSGDALETAVRIEEF
jgi:hypothetical protein